MKLPRVRDFCTLSFDKLFGVYIGKCCQQHDEDWHDQVISKKKADEKLRDCICRTFFQADNAFPNIISDRTWIYLGYFISRCYYYGVRIFGIPFWEYAKLKKWLRER